MRFYGTIEFVQGYSTPSSAVTKKVMSAEIGDLFFCAHYGGSLNTNVLGGEILARNPSGQYPWSLVRATSTTVTFQIGSGTSARFQIGQFR